MTKKTKRGRPSKINEEVVGKLEEAFNCHVDLITMGVSDRDFLKRIQSEELVIYER